MSNEFERFGVEVRACTTCKIDEWPYTGLCRLHKEKQQELLHTDPWYEVWKLITNNFGKKITHMEVVALTRQKTGETYGRRLEIAWEDSNDSNES